MTDSLYGPVNMVAPQPVTNAEFTKTLADVLSRPAIFPMPAFAIKLAFGEMGEAVLLGSQRVERGAVDRERISFPLQRPERLSRKSARALAFISRTPCDSNHPVPICACQVGYVWQA